MLTGEPGGLAALAWLAALVLLPGLLVVRAPWPYVPFLSMAFWMASWRWLEPFGAGRAAFVRSALLVFAALGCLRLLKPLGLRRPRARAMAVLLLAVLPLALVPSTAPVGLDASFRAAGVRVLSWRDGWPVSYEPLLPLAPFGAHAPGLTAVAADVALLAEHPPLASLRLAEAAGLGLLPLACYALLRRRYPGTALAAASLLAALALVTGAPAPTAVALAFAVAGLRLAWSARGWPRASTAGALLGAAVVVQPAIGAVAGIAALGVGWRRRARVPALATFAALLAGPTALTVVRALSADEVRGWLADAGRREAPLPPAAHEPEYAAIGRQVGGLEVVETQAGTSGAWIPALAGRRVTTPWVPAIYRTEWREAAWPPAAWTYVPPLGVRRVTTFDSDKHQP
jgi:hypothetical protein